MNRDTADIPVTPADVQWLADLLLDRVDDDEATEGNDEGILVLSELDGFLTAVVSGPVMIPPSQWLPALWGDFEPEWQSEQDFERAFTIIVQLMNSIASTLMQNPQNFEPVFQLEEIDNRPIVIVDEWCFGYLRGVGLCLDDWDLDSERVRTLLMPILIFGSAGQYEFRDSLDEADIIEWQKKVAPAATELHAYWLALRETGLSPTMPFRHAEPRVGRNDPCPCGSGKKFKKCCLH